MKKNKRKTFTLTSLSLDKPQRQTGTRNIEKQKRFTGGQAVVKSVHQVHIPNAMQAVARAFTRSVFPTQGKQWHDSSQSVNQQQSKQQRVQCPNPCYGTTPVGKQSKSKSNFQKSSRSSKLKRC